MEFHIDSHIAGFPFGRFLFNAERLLRSRRVHELGNVSKVITEWRYRAFFANIIGVQACGLVGGGEAQVAHEECGLAGEIVNDGLAGVAFMNQGLALGNDSLHGFIFCLRNDFDTMGIVEGHLRIVLWMNERNR